MKNNLEEIARRTGYSIATVSRTLNGFKWVSERTRQRILECAREIGILRSGGTIAIIVRSISLSHYHKDMALCLESGIHFAGYRMVLIPECSLDLIEEYNPAGAISVIGDLGLERLWGKRYALPLVCVNAAPRHLEGIFSVYSNEEQGMRLLLEHLLSLGHRRIGMLSYGQTEKDLQNIYMFRDRKKTFEKILSEYGLPDDLITLYGWRKQEYEGTVYHLLEKGVSAIVVMSEGQLMKILYFLKQVGVRVPEDISLCGWLDQVDLSCDLPMTGIMQNYELLAEKAVGMLEKLLRKEPVEKDIIINYRFVSGCSTARPKKGNPVFWPRRRLPAEEIADPADTPDADRKATGGCSAEDPEPEAPSDGEDA